jgi:hypothetical protein
VFHVASAMVPQDGLIHKEEFIRALFDDSHQGNLFADRVSRTIVHLAFGCIDQLSFNTYFLGFSRIFFSPKAPAILIIISLHAELMIPAAVKKACSAILCHATEHMIY